MSAEKRTTPSSALGTAKPPCTSSPHHFAATPPSWVSTVDEAVRIQASGAPEFGVETLIFGIEGDDLLFESHDIADRWRFANHADALAEAGYRIT